MRDKSTASNLWQVLRTQRKHSVPIRAIRVGFLEVVTFETRAQFFHREGTLQLATVSSALRLDILRASIQKAGGRKPGVSAKLGVRGCMLESVVEMQLGQGWGTRDCAASTALCLAPLPRAGAWAVGCALHPFPGFRRS